MNSPYKPVSVWQPATKDGAALRRAHLAKAVAAWNTVYNSESYDTNRDEADIAFEAALIETATIIDEDYVEALEANDGSVTVLLADGRAISIDEAGNTVWGNHE